MNLFPPDQPYSNSNNSNNKMILSRPLASYITYSLGNDLYVPLTSRCNTVTLPETRGPNFLLPASVAASLCRVRDLEHGTQQWTHWCMHLDTQEGPQRLPEAYDRIQEVSPSTGSSSRSSCRLPAISDLVDEIQSRLQETSFDSVVIAGEGEPTLRLDDLLDLAQQLHRRNAKIPIRLITNGLVTTRLNVAQTLAEHGVSKVSVALMTADAHQYQQLMQPTVQNAHETVCKFIQQSIQAGLDVESTAIDRPEVNKERTEAFSVSQLQVASPVRWRPYFP